MALEGNLCSFLCSLGWDLPSFGVLNAEMSMEFLSPLTSDLCSDSGYLEDALGIKWSSCFKKRKTLSYTATTTTTTTSTTSAADSLLLPEFSKQSFWSSDNNVGDPFENSTSLRQKSVNPDDKSSLDCFVREKNTNECTPSQKPSSSPGGQKEQHSSHSSLQVMTEYSAVSKDASLSKTGEASNKKVAYPFDMVKPGGIEGDVTLNDINKRLLMRPTRPVRHPVGDAACHPRIFSDGFGPSGKAVATLTRIHTQGRGSVTIIRTRG